jgi:hypothetical protein
MDVRNGTGGVLPSQVSQHVFLVAAFYAPSGDSFGRFHCGQDHAWLLPHSPNGCQQNKSQAAQFSDLLFLSLHEQHSILRGTPAPALRNGVVGQSDSHSDYLDFAFEYLHDIGHA